MPALTGQRALPLVQRRRSEGVRGHLHHGGHRSRSHHQEHGAGASGRRLAGEGFRRSGNGEFARSKVVAKVEEFSTLPVISFCATDIIYGDSPPFRWTRTCAVISKRLSFARKVKIIRSIFITGSDI